MPAPALTGYALHNHFRRLRQRLTFTPLEAYLFYELVDICNDEGWPAEFSARNTALMAALGCSEPGLIKARKTLVAAGLLTHNEGQNRKPTTYRLNHPKGLTELSVSASTAPAEHLTEGLTELSNPAENEGKHLTEGLTEFSPYKEQTKTKRTIAQSRQNDEPQNAVTFAAFWEAYGKKRDRFKSEKKWETLTAAEQAAALAHAPLFAAATPEKQFRKDPLTYLNGKCWEDEELPAPRQGVPRPVAPAPPPPLPAPELNQELIAELADQEARRFQAHLARHAATA